MYMIFSAQFNCYTILSRDRSRKFFKIKNSVRALKEFIDISKFENKNLVDRASYS